MPTKPQADVLYLIRARIDSGASRGAPQLTKDVRVLKKAADEIERLRGALGAGWQPIETAPKNGAPVLVFWPQHPYGEDDNLDESKVVGGSQLVTSFSGGGWAEPDYLEAVGSYYFDDHAYAAAPTHWKPLGPGPHDSGVKERCPYCLGSGRQQVLVNGVHVEQACTCPAGVAIPPGGQSNG